MNKIDKEKLKIIRERKYNQVQTEGLGMAWFEFTINSRLFAWLLRYDIAKNSDKITNWDYYVFFSIAFYTGLRKGEIFALKWSDIDDEYLSVTRSITQKLKGEDRETPPKTNPLPENFICQNLL